MLRIGHAIVLAMYLGACAREAALSPAEALANAEPRLEHFARFDRWARLGLSAAPDLGNRGSFEETLFAPIRRDPLVVESWVQQEGGGTRNVVFRGRDPISEDLEWVELRNPMEGFRVGLGDYPDRRRGADGAPIPCVFVSRTLPAETSNGTVTVTVAYPRET